MPIDKNSKFYNKATQMLKAYTATGKTVEELGVHDPEYRYIKNSKIYDENGNPIDVKTKFELLGYSREAQISRDTREELIKSIKEYLVAGGSFHIQRKKLPFFEKLHTYALFLKRQGKELTHEQIMKQDLGFREYSDLYYRCQGIEKLKYFRDENGFVDSYKSHPTFNAYIKDIAYFLDVPIYIVITLLADERCSKYEIQTDKIKYTETLLRNYAEEYGTFVGLKKNAPKVYDAFNHLIKYYSDGSEQKYSKSEWLQMFGLGQYEHNFKEIKDENVDIENIMLKLKEKYGQVINIKDLDSTTYRKILKKAIKLNVSVSQICETYGIKCNGISSDRLSKIWVTEIPYIDEMKRRKDELINQSKVSFENGNVKEEIFETKVKIVKQVYSEFKDKIENYLPSRFEASCQLTEETTNSI